MVAKLISTDGLKARIEIEVEFTASMLDSEEVIQKELLEGGRILTAELLQQFDTSGEPIEFGNVRMTSKGKVECKYQTPYGEVEIARHLYQTSSGGKTYCPLEKQGRIIVTSTPKFAKQISWKYSNFGSGAVCTDFAENHGRPISRAFVQDISDEVATIAMAAEKSWNYSLPTPKEPIAAVAIGIDGTCMLTTTSGWRQAMVGSISLYNSKGERTHSIYVGATPEYGKETFYSKMNNEIAKLKEKIPDAIFIGVADGATDNWSYLKQHTSVQVLDFFHVTEYLANVSKLIFKGDEIEKKAWLDETCHRLKNEERGAENILNELKQGKENLVNNWNNRPTKIANQEGGKVIPNAASVQKNKIGPKGKQKNTESKKNSTKKSTMRETGDGVSSERQNKGEKPKVEKKETINQEAAATGDTEKVKDALDSAVTYFTNHISMMAYWLHVGKNHPIGSGVTEAACKMLVKQRLCCSGMRWTEEGAASVLSLRALSHTTGRWEQFWNKLDIVGFSMAA